MIGHSVTFVGVLTSFLKEHQANLAAELASDHLDPVREAISQPTNPHTASSYSTPAVNIGSSYDPTTDPRQPHATSMLDHLASNYRQVYEHAQSKANASALRMAKPKPTVPIVKSASVSKPIPKVHVAITHIENTNNTSGKHVLALHLTLCVTLSFSAMQNFVDIMVDQITTSISY
ncbi:hypothetical protein CPB84DRAFT_1841962 [Gymnopilus junonius]|uniref:Uncharacterized protein n=1 Tax=Gymnopilus junonius TaxID=109634 RepID=A0A9P5P1V4_GYMJU|nr:hypothetical protein CPB84DRAFT_1841962 [Gymnopilus junonius]